MGFVSRFQAERLLDTLADDGAPIVIAAIGGMGGVGKTALAVHWAHQRIHQFSDGQLYVNLRGFEPDGRVLEPGEALNALIEGLGHIPSDSGIEARAARFRSLVAGRRLIIVLDNARDSEQVRPLLPGTAECLVVVTSRNQLAGLVAREGARLISLGRLTQEESRQLLVNRLGEKRINAEPEATLQMIEWCAGLPLALSIAAAQLALNPNVTLVNMTDRFRSSTRLLNELSAGKGRDDLRAVLSWSYRQLSPTAAQLFRRLGAHPGPHFSLLLLASLNAQAPAGARRTVDELVRANLLIETECETFVLHDLLRIYAAELLETSAETSETQQRVIDYFSAAAREAYNAFSRPPAAELDTIRSGIAFPKIGTHGEASDWYLRERASVHASINLALISGRVRSATLLILDCLPMSYRLDVKTDPLGQCLRVLSAAVDNSGRESIELKLIAQLHLDAAVRFGFYPDSRGRVDLHYHFRQALQLFGDIGDLGGQSNVYRALAYRASVDNDHALQAKHTFEAARLARAAQRPELLVPCLLSMMDGQMRHADYEVASDTGEEILELVRKYQLSYLEPMANALLAQAQLALSNSARALGLARAGLAALANSHEPVIEMFLTAAAAQAAMECSAAVQADEYATRFYTIMRDHKPVIESAIGAEDAAKHVAAVDLAMTERSRTGQR